MALYSAPDPDTKLVGSLVQRLRRDGYALVQDFASDEVLNGILKETSSFAARVNSNELGPVIHGPTQFFTNILASSRIACNLILSPFVVSLCTAYFEDQFLLVNNRLQTTRFTSAMPWHTDNNWLANGKLVGRHGTPGLQFVLYLTDVTEAPFQLIADSQHWSLQHQG